MSQKRTIRQLRQARTGGESLSEEERRRLRAYESKHDAGRTTIWAPPVIVDAWRRKAAEQGMRLSPWIRSQVQAAQVGDSEALDAIKVELARAMDEKSAAQAAYGDLSNQVREKDYQIRGVNTPSGAVADGWSRIHVGAQDIGHAALRNQTGYEAWWPSEQRRDFSPGPGAAGRSSSVESMRTPSTSSSRRTLGRLRFMPACATHRLR